MGDDEVPAIVTLCGRGLAACRSRDAAVLAEVMVDLTGALDFGYDRAALALAALYDRGLRDAERGRFERAQSIFRTLLAVAREGVVSDGD